MEKFIPFNIFDIDIELAPMDWKLIKMLLTSITSIQIEIWIEIV